MRSRLRNAGRSRLGAFVALAGLSLATSGCLGEPEVEDRWTRVDIAGASLTPYQEVQAGSTVPITGQMTVTYRAILTGIAVAELRASTVAAASVVLSPDADRPPMATDIDRILANSVTLGRATRAVTGWHHLIQRIDFAFDGVVPAMADSNSAGLFLVCYLGDGEEVERADGSDSLVVTPFDSGTYQILPVGMELGVAPTGGP